MAIRYLTAAYGDMHLWFLRGLTRSFGEAMPDHELHVFREENAPLNGLIAPFGRFYDLGQRVNVFKFALFRRMMERFPEDTICWIDADTLVLDDLTPYLDEGAVNVVGHGRRIAPMPCGHGFAMPSALCVLGGFYALPPGPALRELAAIAHERTTWPADDNGGHSGDLVILNRFVHDTGIPVHRLDVAFPAHIFNFEISMRRAHPGPGDPGHMEIELRNGRPENITTHHITGQIPIPCDGAGLYLWNRKIVLLQWTAHALHEQLTDGFTHFRPEVSARIAGFYA